MKKYNLRPLLAKDIFIFTKILKAIGLKEIKDCFDIKQCLKMYKAKKISVEGIGINMALDMGTVILANLDKCEKAVYEWLSSLSGLTEQEVENLDIAAFTEMVISVFKQEGFKDFLKAVSKLL